MKYIEKYIKMAVKLFGMEAKEFIPTVDDVTFDDSRNSYIVRSKPQAHTVDVIVKFDENNQKKE